jgi:hypothetical protein
LTWLLSQANIPAGGGGNTQPIADGIEWQKLLPLYLRLAANQSKLLQLCYPQFTFNQNTMIELLAA